MDFTTAGLIEDVKLNALLPDGSYTNEDIISFLNDAFYTEAMPFVMKHHEDFFVTYTDFSPAATIAIPIDAVVQKLKDVQLKKDERTFINLPRLSMGEISGKNKKYQGFYIQDNTIVFYPDTPSSTIRLYYYKRPNYLIDSDDDTVFTVTSISGTSAMVNKVSTELGPTSFSLSHSYQPYDTESISSLSFSTSGGNHFEFSSSDIAKITVGDILCPVGYCAFPKLPMEARDILVQAALVKLMISMKDKDGYKLAVESLKSVKEAVAGMISPRIDNEIKKIVNTSGLWGSRNAFRNGWRN